MFCNEFAKHLWQDTDQLETLTVSRHMYISITEFTMKLIVGGTVLLHFELAALAAFGDVFPEAQVKGCLFHYSQAVQRNIG